MTVPHRIVEGVATSDLALEVTGATLPELLGSAAAAVAAVQVADPGSIRPTETRRFRVEGADVEWLLHNLLEEVVFLKDTDRVLLTRFEVSVHPAPRGWEAEVVGHGERIDRARHAPVVDVKAVTWHRFTAEEAPGGWRAFVVLDV